MPHNSLSWEKTNMATDLLYGEHGGERGGGVAAEVPTTVRLPEDGSPLGDFLVFLTQRVGSPPSLAS